MAASDVNGGERQRRSPGRRIRDSFQAAYAKSPSHAIVKAIKWSIGLIALILFLFSWRWVYHPLVLWVRTHLVFVILFCLPILFVAYRLIKAGGRRKVLGRLACYCAAALLVFATWELGMPLHQYASLSWRYQTLLIEELGSLPVSGHERVQPWYGVKSAAHGALGNTLTPSDPAFVRDPDGSYRFTMAFEPSSQYFLSRLGSVNEVYSVPGTAGTISFGPASRIPVSFDVGDTLLLAHSIHTCMVRSLGLSQFFSYEPTDAVYLKDDAGQMVSVVPLIRWTGILFPRPEFGGVQVIPQQPHETLGHYARMLFFGCGGYWVPPDQVGHHPFLTGQNLVPDKVSRYMAESFRFQNGFMAPFPGYHQGDIRIPDAPGDNRDQPFVAFFTKHGERQGKLYQYFGLEPYDETKHGLMFSVFVPADGQGPLLFYDHDSSRHEGLYGPTGIEGAVRGSLKTFDWASNRPVENRPFVHDLCGSRRMMWITTIVTIDSNGRGFTGGSVPTVVITDARDRRVFKVAPEASDQWQQEIEQQMCPTKGR